jgi:hypothetical protein
MDAYKMNMISAYLQKPDEFIAYALGDLQTQEILTNYQHLWQQLCQDIGIKPIKLGATLGSNVSRLTLDLMIAHLEKDSNLVKDLAKLYKGKPRYLKATNLERLIILLNEEATPTWLNKQMFLDNNKHLLSLVDGGYCKNLIPKTTQIHDLLVDLDIHSCYGNGLLNQSYPLGRPCFLSYLKSQKREMITLKQFLTSKYKKDLVPGLWYARISSTKPLSFHQDLFLSKIPNNSSNSQPDNQDNSGEFILLTKEIHHAALTHDLLQITQSVMTNKQWSEFSNNVVIEALIYYPKTLQVETVDQLIEEDLKGCGIDLTINRSYGEVIEDKRSHHWLSIPMGDNWIERLLGMRKNYPKSHPLNNIYKAIINSTYGIIASKYFPISNVVVANNITARSRGLAWMMAKALGLKQIITDGGVFQLNSVNTWFSKQPSMNTLSLIGSPDELHSQSSRHLRTKPLGNLQWKLGEYQTIPESDNCSIKLQRGEQLIEGTPDNYPLINQLAWQHLLEFFPGDIDILQQQGKKIFGYDTINNSVISSQQQGQFSLETKDVYIAASFQSQSNYLLERPNGTIQVKTRGYQWDQPFYLDTLQDRLYEAEHPIIQCLKAIKDGQDIPAFPPGFTPTIITANSSQKPSQMIANNQLLPGETTLVRSWVRPISLSMFRWQNLKQYSSWKKRHTRLKINRGYGVELFFMNADGSIRYQEAVDSIQNAINEGKDWYICITHNDPKGTHPLLPNNALTSIIPNSEINLADF